MTQIMTSGDEAVSAITYGVRDPAIAVRRRQTVVINVIRVLLLVLVLVLWQIFGTKAGEIAASTPEHVFATLWKSAVDHSLYSNVFATMEEVVLGYVIGALGGVLLGTVAAASVHVSRVLDPFIVGIYGVPKIAFAPLLVVWLGVDLAPKIALAAVMVFFLVFFSTFQGIRTVDQHQIDAVRMMGGSPMQVRRYVVFPGARSTIFLGLKLGVPQALIGAIVGEFISSSRGIGYQIQFSTAQLDVAGVFAGLVVLTIISVILNTIVNAMSRDKGASTNV